MNPYMAAAKYVMEKNAPEKAVRKPPPKFPQKQSNS
jgi:hypothetical protein